MNLLEFPLWYNRLRIWHCHSCGIDCSFTLDFIPGPGTSICCMCGQKRKKKQRKKEQTCDLCSLRTLLKMKICAQRTEKS